jgi:(E)-4-hydroxy-3-methylbut-2-enyl-diphosphate synthase
MAETTFAPWVYCPSLTRYERWKTRAVRIGDIGIGGDNPIRVQSMTTTDTMDTAGTVAQSIRMIEAGCELVRITAPSKKEAENLAEIKKKLVAAGYKTPLVADIHFTPNAAEIAARIVEKVRVNPGNYADKKKFDVREYSDVQYEAELERIRERFTPLVRICKEHGTAMRIGTNHGSLSDRILNRYGDTPEGMVESAFEFLRICRDENYHEIVLSMKSSNVQVMVQAYRLLVHRMMAQSWDYPLHLGVTEAGDGEDGRVKSAAGIGALLEDGLGDTVRVSLTEEPESEIPVARALVDRYATRREHDPIPEVSTSSLLGSGVEGDVFDPFTHTRRHTHEVLNIGARHVPVVMADLSAKEKITPATFFAWGYRYSVPSGQVEHHGSGLRLRIHRHQHDRLRDPRNARRRSGPCHLVVEQRARIVTTHSYSRTISSPMCRTASAIQLGVCHTSGSRRCIHREIEKRPFRRVAHRHVQRARHGGATALVLGVDGTWLRDTCDHRSRVWRHHQR